VLSRSLWLDTAPGPPRPALDGDTEADVVVIGAGFTGLWTAYYLSLFDPGRSVLVLDAEHVGYGASGRNGGWCTAENPRLLGTLVRRHGPLAAARWYRAARRTLDEIEAVLDTEGVDGHWRRDGSLYVARTAGQRDALVGWRDGLRKLGVTDLTVLEGDEARRRLALRGTVAAGFTPNCAAVHPARIARGLADAVERRGGRVVERTRALGVAPHRVSTDRGTVRAGAIVHATEAYGHRLAGRRRVLPVRSQVVATAPLPAPVWAELGWTDRVTVTDSRHHFAYLQRTADDRLVAGGCGVSYRYGSRSSTWDGADRRAAERLAATLADFFPALAGVPLTHAWSGVYGLHRDAEPSVGYDPSTGVGHAGGYGGEGVVLSNLAGRTLAALITGTSRPETRLCWVDRRPARWEPEPLRYLGVHGASALAHHADRYEARTGRPAPIATRLLRRLT